MGTWMHLVGGNMGENMKMKLPCGREMELPADMPIDNYCMDACHYGATCGPFGDWLTRKYHQSRLLGR